MLKPTLTSISIGVFHVGFVLILWAHWQTISPETENSDLVFYNVNLQTGLNSLKVEAAKADLKLGVEWAINMTGVEPVVLGNNVVQPDSIQFFPKSGSVILNSINYKNLFVFDKVVVSPSLENITLRNMKTSYSYKAHHDIHWGAFKAESLESRDLLSLSTKYFSTFLAEGREKITESDAKVSSSETVSYALKSETVTLHHTRIHFRVLLKNIELETTKGLVKAEMARLKMGDQFLILFKASVADGLMSDLERVTFNLETGVLELK